MSFVNPVFISSQVVNYIQNGSLELYDTFSAQVAAPTKWDVYKDAAQATPEDGTGGTASVINNAVITTSLRGRKSWQITKTGNAQGEGYSQNFTIEAADKSRLMSINFDFEAGSAYTAGDLVVYVYDVTNSLLIVPATTEIPSSSGAFRGLFTSTASSDYRLIIHCAASNSTTTDWSMSLDSIQVKREVVIENQSGEMPVGSLLAFAGSTSPSGYLLCDGSAISRTEYSSLFTVVGTTYGIGDNATTFNLPDLRGRVAVGRDNMGGTPANRMIGTNKSVTFATGDVNTGTETITISNHGFLNDNQVQFATTGTLPSPLSSAQPYYVIDATTNSLRVSTTPSGSVVNLTSVGSGTHTIQVVAGEINGQSLGATGGWQTHQLVISQLASHTHTQVSHQHSITEFTNTSSGSDSKWWNESGNTTHTSITTPATPTINATGSGGYHQNTQPSIILNYIIKT